MKKTLFVKSLFSCSMICVFVLSLCRVGQGQGHPATNKLRLVIPQGHSEGVTCVAYNPNGQTIASGSADSTIKVWDVSTGILLRTFETKLSGLATVHFSPDGKKLLGCASDNFMLWDVATGKLVGNFEKTVNNVNKFQSAASRCDGTFSADGEMLLCGGLDTTAKLWNIKSASVVRIFSGHQGSVNAVDISPDGKVAVTASQDKTIKLWNVADGTLLCTFLGHADGIRSVTFSPDGKKILSQDWHTTKLWDASTGHLLRSYGSTWVGTQLYSPTFSPDGKTLIAGGDVISNKKWVRVIKHWDIASGKFLKMYIGYTGNPTWGDVRSLAFSPDGKMLLSGGKSNTVTLRNLETGKLIRSFTGQTSIKDVAFRSGEPKFISRSEDNQIRVWDPVTGAVRKAATIGSSGITATAYDRDAETMFYGGAGNILVQSEIATGKPIRTFSGHVGEISSIAVRPDNKMVASGSYNDLFRLWDTSNGKLLHTFDGIRQHTNREAVATFSPDGGTLLFDGDSDATLWDVATGKSRGILSRLNGTFAVSPDGQSVLCGSVAGNLKLFDTATGILVRTFEGRSYAITSLTFSLDGKTIAAGSMGCRVSLFQTATGKLLRTIVSGFGSERLVAFSPNSKSLLVSDWKSINLFDVATGKIQRAFAKHAEEVDCIAFSPSGKTVFSGSRDHTIKQWSAATGQLLHTFSGHAKAVWAISLSPDGHLLASASSDSTIRIWSVADGSLQHTLDGPEGSTISFSPDGKTLVCAQYNSKKIKFCDVASGNFTRTVDGIGYIRAIQFSPDGKSLITGINAAVQVLDTNGKLRHNLLGPGYHTIFSPDGRNILSANGTFQLWDAMTGELLRTFGHADNYRAITFSPDGRTVLIDSNDVIQVWNVEDGQLLRTFQRAAGRIESFAFSGDGKKVLTGNREGSMNLWEAASGEHLVTLYTYGGHWAAVDPSGRYDADSGGSFAGLHWVKGDVQINLDQFKDGFYEPGLLTKKLGLNREPLREVPLLTGLKLFPEAAVTLQGDGKSARVNLTGQDEGGYGTVQVFINDKELLADARPEDFENNAKSASFVVNLDSPLVKKGESNTLRVVTRNAANTLASPPIEVSWQAPGTPEPFEPRLYAIVCGISQYANPKKIKTLRFAAKDARDMALALAAGSKELFGADKTEIQLFTGETSDKQKKNKQPTLAASKANLRAAFEEVAEKARPQDVLVVYFAGHGTTLGLGTSVYVYPTAEADSPDFAKANMADKMMTSDELAEWTKAIPAQKQVLILDTCASGAAGSKLTEKRAVPGDQTRAIERLKDRVGYHVLMGCASDSLSYEATRFNQGLLTYALLEGMKGPTRAAGKGVIQVGAWFRYAQEQVPKLAGSVGGIQRPEIKEPSQGDKAEDFPIAQLDDKAAQNVPLSPAGILVMEPRIVDENAEDALGLETALTGTLQAASLGQLNVAGQNIGGLVYVPVDDLPGAWRIGGSYRVQGEQVILDLTFRDGKLSANGEVQMFKKTLTWRKADINGLATTAVAVLRNFALGVTTDGANPQSFGKSSKSRASKTKWSGKSGRSLGSTPKVDDYFSDVPLPGADEIALAGEVVAVDETQRQLTINVRAFRLPSGKVGVLGTSKAKLVALPEGANLDDWQSGDEIVVLGPDPGSGLKQIVHAREVF